MKKTVLIAVLLLPFASSAVLASEEIANKSGCMACHAKDKKLVGPSFKDVAAKYKGQGDAVAKLTEKVRKGGSGVWGPIPMPPNPDSKISDADLKTVVEWVLRGA
ncbi:MAG: c-type cytochrome [Rhodocyclaceae bacterium]|nr:c-type cytochrome [Rhodocyclaceae bacterium]